MLTLQQKKGKVRAHKRDKQQEIASIVKLALKVPYKKNKITKNDYKCIMKQVVSKVRTAMGKGANCARALGSLRLLPVPIL